MTYRELIQKQAKEKYPQTPNPNLQDYISHLNRWHKISADVHTNSCLWLLDQLNIDPDSKVDPFEGMDNSMLGKVK